MNLLEESLDSIFGSINTSSPYNNNQVFCFVISKLLRVDKISRLIKNWAYFFLLLDIDVIEESISLDQRRKRRWKTEVHFIICLLIVFSINFFLIYYIYVYYTY